MSDPAPFRRRHFPTMWLAALILFLLGALLALLDLNNAVTIDAHWYTLLLFGGLTALTLA